MKKSKVFLWGMLAILLTLVFTSCQTAFGQQMVDSIIWGGSPPTKTTNSTTEGDRTNNSTTANNKTNNLATGSNRTNAASDFMVNYDLMIKQGDSFVHIAVITRYIGSRTDVNIPANIKSGEYIYPVIYIGDKAFANRRITSVIIPDGVSRIGEEAFANNQLTNVTIPNSVIIIGDLAFYNNQLTSVTISSNIISIGEGVFANNQLTNVTIPNGVISIGKGAFGYNQLTNVTIPNSVRTIGEVAFYNNQLTSIPTSNITSIGEGVFAKNKFTNISIPNGVTRIGENAFADNPLTSITLPDSLIQLAANAFTGANNLTQIIIGPNVNFTGNELMTFNFRGAYQQNSLRAGTYTFTDGQWKVKFR